MEAKSIERIAEELGVNFYDLIRLISARDNFMKQKGRSEVVEWIDKTFAKTITINRMLATNAWQAKLKEWGL